MSILESGAWKPAVKSAAKARIAIYGVGGSGKSLSALMIARGLVGKEGTIAVLDTEGGTASIYADRFEFSTIVMNAPFSTSRFRDAVENASQAGFDCLIIDGISPFWDGPGGVLEIVDKAKGRGGGWADGTPAQQIMHQAISTCPIHIIVTMRAKSDTVIEMVNGKATPRKVGMKYVQRDTIEYEVSWLLYADKDHSILVEKTRMSELDGVLVNADTSQRPEPAEALGGQIRAWLSAGVAAPIAATAAPAVDPAAEDNLALPQESEPAVVAVAPPEITPAKRVGAMWRQMDATSQDAVRKACEELSIVATPKALYERYSDAAFDAEALLGELMADVKVKKARDESEGSERFQTHLDAERAAAADENIAAVTARHEALAAAGGYGEPS